MADFNPLSQSISFKDILKSNKKQFDKMFEEQMNAVGLRQVSHRPATLEELPRDQVPIRQQGCL